MTDIYIASVFIAVFFYLRMKQKGDSMVDDVEKNFKKNYWGIK